MASRSAPETDQQHHLGGMSLVDYLTYSRSECSMTNMHGMACDEKETSVFGCIGHVVSLTNADYRWPHVKRYTSAQPDGHAREGVKSLTIKMI